MSSPLSSAASSSPGKALDREQILARLRERIVAFAASRLQRDQAEDLAQEVLIVLEEKYPHVTAIEDLAPLSFQILRFKMAGLRRKSARRGDARNVDVDEIALPDPAPGPEAEAQQREDRERLKAALMKLEGRCREIFRLKLEGRSFPEIREILGAGSLNTVYTWDFRCRQQLLKLLGGRWEAER